MKLNFKSLSNISGKLSLLTCLLATNFISHAQNPKCFEETSSGVIAIEAEDYFSQEKTSKREWFVIGNGSNTPSPDPDGSHASNASGSKYIEVLPDTRVVGHRGPGPEDPLVRGENFSDIAGEMAVLNYKVNFKSAGKYFVWVRLYSSGPEDNSIHVGLNNTWPKSGERMQWCVRRQWEWESKQRTKDQHCGVEQQIYIDVPTAGEHTFQISMREDGVEVDKIILSKQYTKPTGKGPAANKVDCGNNNTENCDLPEITNNSSIAIVADGNSPDPDDIGATAVSLALLKAFGIEKDLVYYSHSCDLDPFSGSNQVINPEQERNRQRLMQTSCDGTASRWDGFDSLTFYNCRTQRQLATNKLIDAINAATSAKPLAIILAGEPDLIYDAVAAARSNKRQYVTIVSHHIANEESADEAGKNISNLVEDFSAVDLIRIPDQNDGLKTLLPTWHWARDHQDSRINWLWKQGKIAEEDGVVKFQDGDFDCSDAGMLYYQITGNRTPNVSEIRKVLECYTEDNTADINQAPTVNITSPANNATFEIGEEITLSANASDSDGNLEKVNFKINDEFHKTISTRPFTNSFILNEAGTYKITAKAFDSDGLTIEKSVNITVNAPVKENVKPTVSITSPSQNATFNLGEEIILQAAASDSNGNLEKVNFKINDSFYRTVSSRPFTSNFTPNAIGSYKISAKAFDKEGLSNEVFITINVIDVSVTNASIETNLCDFGLPSSNPLPNLERKTYTKMHVFGNSTIELSNFRSLRINWNLTANRLDQLSINTENGAPSYYINLKNFATYKFNTSSPELTITNSGIRGLDGSYWIDVTNENLILVAKDSSYALYLSNDDTKPSCSENIGNKLIANSTNFSDIVIYPNPVIENTVSFKGLKDASFKLDIFDLIGRKVLSKNFTSYNNEKIDVSAIASGAYIAKVTLLQKDKIFHFIKE